MTNPTHRLSRRRRRAFAIVVGAGLALFVLELVLQVLAFVLWRGENAPLLPSAERVALCVGDSFTFGLFASAPEYAYPAQAQRLADQQQAGAWSFVNGGKAGQTSSDVLLRLPRQLQQLRPDVVYVLVGTNDHYFRPEPLDAARLGVDAQSFPWRWRTLRLLQLVVGTLQRAGDGGVAEQPFVGLWHNSEVEFEFVGDRFRFGDQQWRWSLADDGQLLLHVPGGDDVLKMAWHMDGARLWVEAPIFGTPYLLEPGPLPGPLDDVLRHHLRLIAAQCRAAGSRCVLLDYPPGQYAVPGLNETLRGCAAELGVDLVDVEAHFRTLGSGDELAKYFVADGHCSDLGYGEMGRLVFEHVRQLPR